MLKTQVNICNLDIEFNGLLGSYFLEHYNWIIDFNKKQLVTNFKTMAILKVIKPMVVKNKPQLIPHWLNE